MHRLSLLCAGISLLMSCGARSDLDRGERDAGRASCEDLERELAQKLAVAQTCDPTLDEPSCGQIVEGNCCPVVVSPENPNAVADYQATLARGRANGCFTQLCKTVKCAKPSDGDCVSSAAGVGQCQPLF